MKNFTVILLRPDYLAQDDFGGFGQDVYTGLVQAVDAVQAIAIAQAEVYKFDAGEATDPDDYAPVVVFPGHLSVALWGWQV